MPTASRTDLPAIVGVCVPQVASSIPDETDFTMTLRAIRGALADAGIDKDEVNGICIDWPGPGGFPDAGSNWARQLGITVNWLVERDLDASGVRAVLNAAAAIQAGYCETVVIAAGVAGGMSSGGAVMMEKGARGATFDRAVLEFNQPYGGARAITRMAMNARRHMHDYGTTSEQIANVAATIRNHGHVNPEAIMYGCGPYTADDILASRLIADPIRLLECSLVGQGGCAVVMTTGERARALRRDPVHVLAGAMEIDDAPHANPARNRDSGMILASRMKAAYARAGIGPDDLDVISVYDATAFEVIRAIEALGLCGEGEGGPFSEGSALAVGGRIPTNTDGGELSHAFFPSPGQQLLKVIEGVRQLRGGCGERQVQGAEVAACVTAVPAAHHVEAVLLGAG
jgi:acetyl-CoA acetyltransferase